MNSPDYSISTPENVDLHLELAGLGNRALACVIDTLISYAICAVVWLGVWGGCTLVTIANKSQAGAIMCGIIILLGMLTSFAVIFGYYIVFEGVWQGQTPGKRVAQIRVIDQNGQPVTWFAVWARNLVRIIDMGLMFIGLLVILIDKNERRLGDFAAGTLVIRERMPNLGTTDLKISPAAKDASTLDVGRITPQEYDLLISFLKRREKMARSQRPLVARELEQHFRAKLSEPTSNGNENAELFLERIYSAYQSRAD